MYYKIFAELFEKKTINDNSKEISREKEKALYIKYKATSKIPNYLDLDISTFAPSDISKLVNFVIKNLEAKYSIYKIKN